MTSPKSRSLQAPSLSLALAPAAFVFIWSTGFIVARYGMPHAPPMKFLALRYALSVGCFLLWATVSRAPWPKTRRQWLHLFVVGTLINGIYLAGVWSAVKAGMGAGLTALIVGLQPVLTALWVSTRGARLRGAQWLGLAMGLAGLLLVVWQKLHVGEVSAFTLTCTVISLFAITSGTLYQKRFVEACDVRTANLLQLIAAFTVTLPFALLEPGSFHWTSQGGELNIELIGAMGWSVLGLTIGGSSLLYVLIQRGAATSVSSLFYLVPPTTAILAWVMFSEPISMPTVIGMALTAAGVCLTVRRA
nr:DMT family transporter [uncultured Cupriavidus sp.]